MVEKAVYFVSIWEVSGVQYLNTLVAVTSAWVHLTTLTDACFGLAPVTFWHCWQDWLSLCHCLSRVFTHSQPMAGGLRARDCQQHLCLFASTSSPYSLNNFVAENGTIFTLHSASWQILHHFNFRSVKTVFFPKLPNGTLQQTLAWKHAHISTVTQQTHYITCQT